VTSETPRRSIDELVAAFQPLAHRLARRYSTGSSVDADLMQVANLGLVLAAQRYDPELGTFQAFALSTVSGELKKHLRDHGWLVRVPRSIQEHSLDVDKALVMLEQRLGGSPSVEQLAEETGLDTESVLVALRAREVRFSNPMPDAEPPARIVDLEEGVLVREALSRLPAGDSELLHMIQIEELTQREVAARLGVSQTSIHRRLNNAHRRLRQILSDMGYVRDEEEST
jgi:RNA polymerase sigma-B factor